jgi:predicted ribosomally synthesized peptide with nif11-like leader
MSAPGAESSTQAFLDRLKSDPEFAEAVKSCTTASEIVVLAAENGIALSSADIMKTMAASSPELTDEELSSVTTDTVMAAALVK